MGNITKIKGSKEIEVKNLLDKGVKQTDIEKITGISQSSISRYVQRIQDNDPLIKKFEEVKSKGLANLQLKGQALRGMIYDDLINGGEKVIEGMSTNEKRSMIHSLTVCGAIDTEKQRLLEDKSTQNINTQTLVGRVDDDIRKIREELQEAG